MSRYINLILATAILVTPLALNAADDHGNRVQDHRYYDRNGHDWHNWNDQEENAYKTYQKNRQREYHAWSKTNRRDQQDYWKWRHQHPDSELFPNRR